MIFTLLICCFLGLGALQPSCAAPISNENNIVEVEKSPRQMINHNNYKLYGINDLYNPTYLYNITIQWCSIDLNNIVYNQANYYEVSSCQQGIYLVGYSDLNFNNQDFGMSSKHNELYSFYIMPLSHSGSADTSKGLYWINYRIVMYFQNYLGASTYITYDYFLVIESNGSGYVVASDYSNTYPTSSDYFVSTNPYFDEFFEYDVDFRIDVAYQNGYDTGYQSGVNSAQTSAYNNGYSAGYDAGETSGNATGYQTGYAVGLSEAQSQSTTASQIFAGCVEVGLLPVNVFLKMFEYEVFGINIAGFVSALMTIALVIIIIRMVTGGKNDK